MNKKPETKINPNKTSITAIRILVTTAIILLALIPFQLQTNNASADTSQLKILVYEDGFEGKIADFWDQVHGTPKLSTAVSHSGGYSYVIDEDEGGLVHNFGSEVNPAVNGTWEFEAWFYDNSTSALNFGFAIGSASGPVLGVLIGGGGDYDKFYNYRYGGNITPTLGTIPRSNGWHKVNINSTPENATIIVDDIQLFQTETQFSFNRFFFGDWWQDGSISHTYYDDVKVWNTLSSTPSPTISPSEIPASSSASPVQSPSNSPTQHSTSTTPFTTQKLTPSPSPEAKSFDLVTPLVLGAFIFFVGTTWTSVYLKRKRNQQLQIKSQVSEEQIAWKREEEQRRMQELMLREKEEKRKRQIEHAKNLERAGLYEEAAQEYMTLDMLDKAGECRRMAKTTYVISTNFNVGKDGGISVSCPHCSASQPIREKSNEVVCNYCGKTYIIPRKALDLL